MSLNDILGSALSGLSASQASLRTVSNNIANVNTPGYAREQVSLSTGTTAGRISGVTIAEPTRVADRFLEQTVYRRAGELGSADVASSYLDRLQSLLGAPGAESGLAGRLDAISSAAIAMTGAPGSEATVADFTSTVGDTISTMRQLDEDVVNLRADADSEIGFTVEKVNGLLQRIHSLNGEVSRLDGLGRSSAGPADQRAQALGDLSNLLRIDVRDQPDGSVTVDAAGGLPLIDGRLRLLSYPTAGQSLSQPSYPAIGVRFANADGSLGAATGQTLDSAVSGGKLGGLIGVRDFALPAFTEQLGSLFGGLAQTLNAASNAGTTVPAPNVLQGRRSGLAGTDRLGFTGAATFAVVDSAGKLVARTSISFDAIATVDDAVTAINAGLGVAATASFANGKLSLTASGSGKGVIVAQDDAAPSARAGIGFSQYFGLNDLVTSASAPLIPSGFAASDPHGFAAGQVAQFELRDSSGRVLASEALQPAAGGTFGDLVDDLNAGPIARFGSFSLDDRGRLRFDAGAGISGVSLGIPVDSTDRLGSGRSLSALLGVNGTSAGLGDARLRSDIAGNGAKLPLARLQQSATVGEKAVGVGDVSGATGFVDALGAAQDLGKDGVMTIERFSALVTGRAGLQASQASEMATDAEARHADATNRRDSFSGVNIDEELAQLSVLQNSYSASARVISSVTQMYDALIAMVG